ncbi:hypothetical protein [Alteromonas sp. RKMC-009]|uniref:hypothetical protein n=1 Tax=Alteromonas sp. RKMC-009 TaxID=2267264 RepID=UPI000F0CA54C|nr:hypothetical protein [Alteromonas sp. RKMC-009]AYN07609.1 hypothetical protein DS731_21665 [Alteromonas sp. RKMC-009]
MRNELAHRLPAWQRNIQTVLNSPGGDVKLACGIKTAIRILDEWALAEAERPPVFRQPDLPQAATYSATDTAINVSLLLSIYALLLQWQQDKGRCQRWLRWEEPALAPHTPVSLISQGIPGLFRVRKLLAARCA